MSESKRGEEKRKVYMDHDSDDEGISRVELMKYRAEVAASGGYDVGLYSSNLCGMIHPITSYADMAVDHYNGHNVLSFFLDSVVVFLLSFFAQMYRSVLQHTNFKVVELLKANISVVSGFFFYFTFNVEESNTGRTETFQARVWSKIPGPNGEDRVKIDQCRVKPTTS
ncbi:hypothetical protein V6N13_140235 [Hibiscus sabdariffa]|uniref:Uncharacterized protein n=1 Tax=Hibiscus sabdariffa TaxID=183260 RepID=A0ABR2QAP8_9ROSI